MKSQLSLLKAENRKLRDELAKHKQDILAVVKRHDELQEAAACWAEVVRLKGGAGKSWLDFVRKAAGVKA